MFKTGEEIIVTKDWILKNLNQEEIFEAFIGHRPVFKQRINSPFREDNNPSCSYYWSNGKLLLKDFATGRCYDCFNVAGNTLGEAMNNIAIKFGLRKGNLNKAVLNNTNSSSFIATPTIIQIKSKAFTKDELAYWSKYNLTLDDLTFFNVSSVAGLWINNNNVHISFPCFAYYFNNGYYKILQPNSKDYKWISNTTRSKIQGYNQLPPTGDLLILTKSLKDVMCYYKLGLVAVALQSESMVMTEEQYNHLSQRFKRIIINFDFDYAGVTSTNQMKKKYNLEYIFLTNGRFNTIDYEAKDISDYIAKFNFNKAKELIYDTSNRM
jgi:hypothetical protein